MKGDEQFMSGTPAITREIALYLVAVFASVVASSLIANYEISWPGALRMLAAIAGA